MVALSPFIEFLDHVAMIMTGYIGLLLLWFIVTQFPTYRWRLFFVRKGQLISLQQHEMYSCLITVTCFFWVRVLVEPLEVYLLMLDIDLNSKIKIFYSSQVGTITILIVSIFLMHRFIRCLFSVSTRVCLYALLVCISVSFIQLVARGYFDYHELSFVYKLGGWGASLVSICAMSLYPIRQTLAYFKRMREG
ncbi:hypothetical protein PSECIP111951_03966 [Pseudoalteromonas holothuriae]|uniref:Uncharacterized protein n=1 Tax=Pseudoalteromonas holothuriae TaxID=2963714 RepID=A0ABM9GN90_9GAMM|nr:hypothetical protein PSECIP111951_03966 [Pseudoalteromonas sp. CIP111951]